MCEHKVFEVVKSASGSVYVQTGADSVCVIEPKQVWYSLHPGELALRALFLYSDEQKKTKNLSL